MVAASRTPIIGLAAIFICGCNDQGPSANGSARVVVSTVGLDLDVDGYSLTIDTRAPRAISINATLQLDSLPTGSRSVRLGGLASNCAVTGANPVSVDVIAGTTAEISFAVACTVRFVAVSAGWGHTCAITTRGSAYCWGDNYFGQLGDGRAGIGSRIPVKVLGGLVFAAVSAGSGLTCDITTDSRDYCWGRNDRGTLGNGTTTGPEQCGFQHIPCSAVPLAVSGGHTFSATSPGGFHTCGLAIGGQGYCWGFNGWGALGDGTIFDRASPVAVVGGHTFAVLGVGAEHTCGVTTGGDAYCWGGNSYGQLGNGGDTALQHTSPIAVVGGLTFSSVSAAYLHTCGVATGGQAYCWGTNYFGQLGDGASDTTHQDSPVAVVGGLTFATVSAGTEHTCGLTTEGVAYCWGYAYAVGRQATPLAVEGGLTFAALSGGGNHTCGITRSGLLYCWGSNGAGELGDGTVGDWRTTPVKVFGQP